MVKITDECRIELESVCSDLKSNLYTLAQREHVPCLSQLFRRGGVSFFFFYLKACEKGRDDDR